MSKPLVSSSIAAPGFLGINTQEASVTLEDGYALEAVNCIIDKYGRLGSRKGHTIRTSAIGNLILNGVTSWNRASEIASVRRNVTGNTPPFEGTIIITFDENHGYTVGQTVELVGFRAAGTGGGDYSIVNQMLTLPANETTYTFTVTSTTVLTSVDALASGPPSSNTNTDVTFVAFVSPPVPAFEGSHRQLSTSGAEAILTWGYQDHPDAPSSDFGFYIFFDSNNSPLIPLPTLTGNTGVARDFMGATLNNKAFFFQESYRPMQYLGHPITGIALGDIEANFASYIDPDTGVAFANEAAYRDHIPQAGIVLSAYGRLWCASTATDKTTLYFSDLLDGSNWVGGSSGSLDMEAILVDGGDVITGLGAQNGQLIVFFRNSIVVLADNSGSASLDPAQFRLVEVIKRVGCVSKYTVQNTGTDIIFLSEDGLRSLGRVIQEKSLPMRDLSANVRDALVEEVNGQPASAIKSVYSEDNAFYLLLLPLYNKIYCFDTRQTLQNGALRVTVWDNQAQGAMLSTPNKVFFTGSYGLAEYSTYLDDTENYYLKYYTNYFDMGNPNQLKSIKKLGATVIGGSGQDFVLKVGFDYEDAYDSFPSQLATADVAEYGVSEYNIGEFSLGTVSTGPVKLSVGGSGSVLQVGFETDISGNAVSIQKIDVYAKQGRIV